MRIFAKRGLWLSGKMLLPCPSKRELNTDSQHYVKSKETHISSKVNQVSQD